MGFGALPFASRKAIVRLVGGVGDYPRIQANRTISIFLSQSIPPATKRSTSRGSLPQRPSCARKVCTEISPVDQRMPVSILSTHHNLHSPRSSKNNASKADEFSACDLPFGRDCSARSSRNHRYS